MEPRRIARHETEKDKTRVTAKRELGKIDSSLRRRPRALVSDRNLSEALGPR